eukprot:TRINITY_DN6315_c0_g1_i11.p1 TRINITY_DN6315_c0_g1~~TRINITY_DN6315_c0_g1_i11.p1  ORF type:complete len:388 (-),score=89.16 TRINITY_DN6315_c0_g1_i11:313-1476(-)
MSAEIPSYEKKILRSFDCNTYEQLYEKMTRMAVKNDMKPMMLMLSVDILKTMGVSHPAILFNLKMIQAGDDWEKRLEEITADLRKLKEAPKTLKEPKLTPITDCYEGFIVDRLYDSGVDLPGSKVSTFGLGYFDELFMSMFLGNYEDFKEIIESMSVEQLNLALKTRVGYFQVTPIFVPIMGFKMTYDMEKVYDKKKVDEIKVMFPKRDNQFIQILDKLIELGAKVDVQDRNGKTPLFYICLVKGKQPYIMAEKLLQAGADPNKKDRNGSCALGMAKQPRWLKMAELLIRYNADPTMKDMNNVQGTPHFNLIEEAAHDRDLKFLNCLIKSPRAIEAKSCGLCFSCVDPTADKRCGRCRIAWYCSLQCQRQDWTKHKAVCKLVKSMTK